MSVSYRAGDLFAADLPALAHGCNCAGAMGKGIAVEFRRRWPAMFEEYKRRCRDGSFRLGDVFAWQDGGRTIFNLGTQQTWRTKAELQAIEAAVRTMIGWAEQHSLAEVGMPKIGAGLGGLPWPQVAGILEETAGPSAVSVVVFELLKPGERSGGES